ncbi:MAG: PAS domain S-box protein [Bacteroidales bacterium]|nr:PAS domain S-box protein [Bacteroidales bacterium]
MKLKNKRWRFKLISLFTVILLASMVVQIFYGIPYIRNREIENTKLYQDEIANNIARELDVSLNRIKDRLQRMSTLPGFRNMDINAMQNILLEQEIISERISSIAVMNHEGRFVCGTIKDISDFAKKIYADRPYFSIPFNEGKTHFTSPRYYANENLIAFSICIPIESESGDRVGVLMGGMDLADIIKRVEDYPLAKDRVACIISNEGIVVAHSGIDLYALKEGPLSLSLDCDFIQSFLNGEIDIPMKHAHEGADYYGSYTLLESTNWGVIVEVPIKSILSQSNIIYNRIVFFEISIFIIALIITIIFARQITKAQRKAEDALQKSENRLNAFSDISIDAIFFSDKGICIEANQRASELFGYSYNELMGMFGTDVIAPESKELVSQNILSGYEEPYDAIAQKKDGSRFYGEFHGKIYNYEGKNVRVTSVRDITDRKKAEEALKANKEKFHTIADFTQDWEYWINPQDEFIYISPSCKRITGYSPNEFKQKPGLLTSIVHPDDVNIWKNHKHNAFDKTEIDAIDFRIITKSGEERWIGHICQTVYNENGVNLGVRGSNRDITERKLSEEKIIEKSKELEKQFQKSEEQRIATLSVLSDLNETSKNLRLEVTERKLAEQIQKVLYNISNAVITTESFDELTKRIHEELDTIIDTTNFYFALYDSKTDIISLPFFKDENDSITSFPAGKTLCHYVIRTNRSLLATKE